MMKVEDLLQNKQFYISSYRIILMHTDEECQTSFNYIMGGVS